MTAQTVRISVTAPTTEICLMRAFEELVTHASGDHALSSCDSHEVARAVDWLHAKYGSKKP